MLRLERVRAGYGAIEVLFDISLEVAEREFVCVLGPNGAGKTSLLRTIMGAARVTGGAIEFEGRDLVHLPEHRRAELGIGYVPEGRQVWPSLTVDENLRLGAWANRSVVPEQFEVVLTLFPRLRERLRHRGGVLSGGEQQMVAIGRALMSKPRLMLIDEPSLGLAPLAYEAVLDALVSLRAERPLAVLLVEQKAQEAVELCDRAYVLMGGIVQASGARDEIRKKAALEEVYFG